MSTTFAAGRTFTLYDLHTSPDIIQKQSLGKKWGHLKNHARSVASLRMLNSRSRMPAQDASEIHWAVGDPFSETEALKVDFVYTDSTIVLTNDYHQSQDVFYLFGNTAGSGSTKAKALVRLGTKVGATATGYRYNVEVLAYDGTTPTFPYSATVNTAVVVKVMAAVKYADQAREYLNAKGDLAKNIMQRSRTTYGKSLVEQSQPSLVDTTLEHLTMLGYEHEARKLNKALFTNDVAIGLGSSTQKGNDYGLAGFFPYHFNPHKATFADSAGVRTAAADGYYGINRVFSTTGGAISYDDILTWLSELAEYGGPNRMVFLSPYMYRKMMTALQNRVAITVSDYAQVAPTFADVWNLPVAQFGFMNLWFVVDQGLTGVPQTLKDDDDPTLIADANNWMVAFDPEQTFMTPQRTKDGVTHEMRVIEVSTTNNDDIDKIEIESIYSFGITDPRTGGYFGTKTA